MDMIEQQFSSTRLHGRPQRLGGTSGRCHGEDGYTNTEAEEWRRPEVRRERMQACVEDVDADEPDPSVERAAPHWNQGKGEGPTAQPRRRKDTVNPATQARGDAPLLLEKRQGGGYHRRPAAKFAREELRPRAAPRSSPSADGRHEASNDSHGSTGKRSARRKAHTADASPSPEEGDPFENFPLHIRPMFNTSYRPCESGVHL